MAVETAVEWSDASWNPVTGCTPVSEGCDNCYAEATAAWLQRMGMLKYKQGFDLALHESTLGEPLKWKKSKKIFAVSMGDLFHPDVPQEFRERVFGVMVEANWHTFIVLTKRSRQSLALAGQLPWPENLWMGVTIEHNNHVARADDLREIPAARRVLSVEPLLGPLPDLDLTDIDWVIVGGESGPGARPMDAGWVRDIRDRCVAARIPFFFKHWGGTRRKKTGRVLDGRTWDEEPAR